MIRINRFAQIEDGTFGVLIIDGKPLVLTLEPPWLENKPEVSCIPEGIYDIEKINSPKFGIIFDVLNVPGRAEIRFAHIGNTKRDTEGCVLVGSSIVEFEEWKLLGIGGSRLALGKFLEATKLIQHEKLAIKNTY